MSDENITRECGCASDEACNLCGFEACQLAWRKITALKEELKRTKDSLFSYKRANEEIREELKREREAVDEYASEGFYFSISDNFNSYPVPRRDDWGERFSDRAGLVKFAGKLARETQKQRKIEL